MSQTLSFQISVYPGTTPGNSQKLVSTGHRDSKDGHPPKQLSALELAALKAMSAVLCCGEVSRLVYVLSTEM